MLIFKTINIEVRGSHYNADGYRCILAFYAIEKYSQTDRHHLILDGNRPGICLDQNDFYFRSCLVGYWCSCKSGQRTLGACSHVIAVMVGLGRPGNYQRSRFLLLDEASYMNT